MYTLSISFHPLPAAVGFATSCYLMGLQTSFTLYLSLILYGSIVDLIIPIPELKDLGLEAVKGDPRTAFPFKGVK